MTIIRAGVGFLLGLLIGVLATVAFFIRGGSDYFVRVSPLITDLKEQVGEVRRERDAVAERLEGLAEKFTGFSDRMEGRYIDLEKRFLQLQRRGSTGSREEPASKSPEP